MRHALFLFLDHPPFIDIPANRRYSPERREHEETK
jgi:hypothetical protein